MATESARVRDRRTAFDRLQYGVAGGVVAGLVMGAMVQVVLGRMTAIGALYTLGEPSLTVGWMAHLFHSALFGAVFGFLSGIGPLRDRIDGYGSGLAAGVAFATLLWAVNIVFLWPLWLNAVSLGGAPAAPYLSPRPFVSHVVFGAVLGLVVAALDGRADGDGSVADG
jgi:hypothetical protein